jgi:hypothetical protein
VERAARHPRLVLKSSPARTAIYGLVNVVVLTIAETVRAYAFLGLVLLRRDHERHHRLAVQAREHRHRDSERLFADPPAAPPAMPASESV